MVVLVGTEELSVLERVWRGISSRQLLYFSHLDSWTHKVSPASGD